MDMVVLREEIYTQRSLETGDMSHEARPHAEAPGSVRKQVEQAENVDKKLYCSFPRKTWEVGSGGLALACLNNFGGLQVWGAVRSCPVPRPPCGD